MSCVRISFELHIISYIVFSGDYGIPRKTNVTRLRLKKNAFPTKNLPKGSHETTNRKKRRTLFKYEPAQPLVIINNALCTLQLKLINFQLKTNCGSMEEEQETDEELPTQVKN